MFVQWTRWQKIVHRVWRTDLDFFVLRVGIAAMK